jgi:hypothetical protein
MLLKMKTSLCGPELSLAPGDEHDFTDEAEAQRLIDAGFAEPAVDATPPPPSPPKQPAKAGTGKSAKAGA